jgi:Flp pilus assembly protein TadG
MSRGARGWSTRKEQGAAAIEFALVMLPLVVLLFGAIQYGLYFWAMQGGSDVARSAVRDSAVGDATAASCTDFRDGVKSQIDGLSGDSATATIKRTFVYADGTGPLDEGDKVRISVQFKSIDMNFPFVPFVHDGQVTSTVTSRVDFVNEDHPLEECP